MNDAMYMRIYRATQSLTDNMDEKIGFPLRGVPDYENLTILFFNMFHDLAIAEFCRERKMTNDDALKTLVACGKDVVRSLCDELLQRREESKKTCKWNPMMSDVYETECEITFMLNEGTLRENNMTFLPFLRP